MSDYTLEEVLEFINGEIEDAYTEACKNLSTARKFVSDVQKLAKNYDANFFIVTDGASSYSNGNGKSSPAVKNARNSQIEWEKKHGFDPDEDWSNDCTDLFEFGDDIDTVYEGFFDRFKKKESKSMNNQTLNSTVKKYSAEELKNLDNLKKDIIRFANEKFKLYIKDPKYRKDVLDYMNKCNLEEADLPNNLRFEVFDDRDPDFITLQIMDPNAGYVEQDINIALLKLFKAIGNDIATNQNFSKIAKIKSLDYGDGDEGCFSVDIELKGKEKECYNMSNHTLENALEFINSEIEDAYTEASKEEADELAEKGKQRREDFSERKLRKFGDKALPKGDPETVRRKNIRKETGFGTYVSQLKKKPGKRYYDHPRDISLSSGNSPYNNKYIEISNKEMELRDKIMKKADDFKRKKGKEYEVYRGGKDIEAAKDFIKKTRSEGKRPISRDTYKKNAHITSSPEYKESRERERNAARKLDVSDRLAEKAKKGFKNKDVEDKWKKFADKYEETVYDILEAYEYDVISYEAANDYIDMLDLFED